MPRGIPHPPGKVGVGRGGGGGGGGGQDSVSSLVPRLCFLYDAGAKRALSCGGEKQFFAPTSYKKQGLETRLACV